MNFRFQFYKWIFDFNSVDDSELSNLFRFYIEF
nr:MAG TPA: hypothetical protein [Caudoviricetes sp.]